VCTRSRSEGIVAVSTGASTTVNEGEARCRTCRASLSTMVTAPARCCSAMAIDPAPPPTSMQRQPGATPSASKAAVVLLSYSFSIARSSVAPSSGSSRSVIAGLTVRATGAAEVFASCSRRNLVR